jgi:hypothetical protein
MCSYNFKDERDILANQIANNQRSTGWSQRIASFLNNNENASQHDFVTTGFYVFDYLKESNIDMNGYQMMKVKEVLNRIR